MNIKDKLEERNISNRDIANHLGYSQPVVNNIINGIYKGSEFTKRRVLDYIDFLLSDKVDINPFVNKNLDLTISIFRLAIRKGTGFTRAEEKELMGAYLTLIEHKEYLSEKTLNKIPS